MIVCRIPADLHNKEDVISLGNIQGKPIAKSLVVIPAKMPSFNLGGIVIDYDVHSIPTPGIKLVRRYLYPDPLTHRTGPAPGNVAGYPRMGRVSTCADRAFRVVGAPALPIELHPGPVETFAAFGPLVFPIRRPLRAGKVGFGIGNRLGRL